MKGPSVVSERMMGGSGIHVRVNEASDEYPTAVTLNYTTLCGSNVLAGIIKIIGFD